MKILERNKMYVLVFAAVFLNQACNSNKMTSQIAKETILNCRNDWVFVELNETVHLEVLLFQPNYSQTADANPAFLIGVTTFGDTIGAIDKTFIGELNTGDKVRMTPSQLALDSSRINNLPVFLVFRKKKYVTVLCSVTKIYNATFFKIE